MGDVRADGDVRSSSSIVAELRKQKLEQKFHAQKKKTEERKSPFSKSERAERNDETAERRNNGSSGAELETIGVRDRAKMSGRRE